MRAMSRPMTTIGMLLNGSRLRSHVRETVGALPSELVAMSEIEPALFSSIRYCSSTAPFSVFFSIHMSESARVGAPFALPPLAFSVFSVFQFVSPVILVAGSPFTQLSTSSEAPKASVTLAFPDPVTLTLTVSAPSSSTPGAV